MAKGWTKIKTVNDIDIPAKTHTQRSRNDNAWNVMIKNSKPMTIKEMKDEGNALYKKRCAEEECLLLAFENKKLKSKDAIKRALQLKKEREKADAKTEQKEKEEVEQPQEELA